MVNESVDRRLPEVRFAALLGRILAWKLRPFRKLPLLSWIVFFVLSVYLSAGVWTVVEYVEPWTKGDISTRIGADSDRYWSSVQDIRDQGNVGSLVTVTGNYLGPALIGLAFRNSLGVMLFNVLVFCASLAILSSIPGVNTALVALLLLLNAELLPSITTLNKEILALLAAAMTAKYIFLQGRQLCLLLAILLVCLFARWEQAAILLFSLALFRTSRGRPWWGIAALVATITVAYPFAFRLLGVDPSIFDWLLADAKTILILNRIQDSFGFPIVLAPKAVMLIAGKLVQPAFYTANDIGQGLTDPQQQIFQPLGCAAYAAVFGWAWFTGKLSPARPLAFFVIVTVIVTAASPFIQPRYLFSTYVLLCVEIASKDPFRSQADTPAVELSGGG